MILALQLVEAAGYLLGLAGVVLAVRVSRED